MRALLTIAIILTFSSGLAHGQTPDPDQLESLTKAEAEARAKEARLAKERKAVASEIDGLKKQLQERAVQTRVFEQETTELQDDLAALTADYVRLTTKLSEDRASIVSLLAALQRLETTPPPALLTGADDAIKAAQAAQLMANLSQSLGQRANKLALSLTEISQAKAEISARQNAIAANQKKLQSRNSETKKLVDRKTDLRASIATEEAETQKTVKRLAAESATLRELISKLEQEVANIGPRVKPKPGVGKSQRPAAIPLALPDGTKAFAASQGAMMRPVSGKLSRNFGKGEKGLTYVGRSNGQVLAPYAGRVEFAGPFKNYDKVVILNVGDGYFILLTGLGEIYSETGDVVRIGEPIGVLPHKAKGEADLYIELRKDGKSVNPVPWLRPRPVKSG